MFSVCLYGTRLNPFSYHRSAINVTGGDDGKRIGRQSESDEVHELSRFSVLKRVIVEVGQESVGESLWRRFSLR